MKRLPAALLAVLMVISAIPAAALPVSAAGNGAVMNMNANRTASFDDGWKFSLGANVGAEAPAYSDAAWQEVTLPHDWMISQGAANFYKTSVGWYRKTFYLPTADNGKNIAVQFDGVYMDSTVYINGQQAGVWKYGYTSFQFDITQYLNYGNTPNVIAVRVNYQSPNTRWYSGAGIYRNVWLTVTDPVHVGYDGTYVSTDGNTVKAETEVMNTSSAAAAATVTQTVTDADGNAVAAHTGTVFTVQPGATVKDDQSLTVADPTLWDTVNPYLYALKTEVSVGGVVRDTYTTPFGFRTIKIDPQTGFYLNGQYMKLHGVDMHQDLGALGSAVNVRATQRQIEILKGMGVNAIRTSHNPPSPELLTLCDQMGILVIDESFDMWNDAKNSYDYHQFFAQWSETDTRSWIRRDRDHPSVIMWSIGNEVVDTTRADGIATAQRLLGYISQEDPNKNALRTIGSNYMANDNAVTIGLMLDAAGMNYTEELYDSYHVKYPTMGLMATESASAVRSRGIYHFPADQQILQYFDEQCSSYDNSVVPWGDSAEQAWKWDRDRSYVLGEFVWSGFDYIGEPTPYGTKNSYFGIVDTAGLPKDIYYFYQSIWTDTPMVHLLPYWDWTDGQTIPVWAYCNADSVELFQDGVSLGKQKVDLNGDVLHSEWKVPYKAGKLTAKAYDAAGNVVATDTIQSFGDGTQVKLTPDRTSIAADGKDLVFVNASILDQNGTFVANARNRVEFTVTGGGTLVGVDNGDSTDMESYQAPARKAFSGQLVAIVQSDGSGGPITITATSPGLKSASVTVNAVHTNPVTGVTLSSIDGSDAITTNRGMLDIVSSVAPANADCQKVAYSVTNADGSATDKAAIDQNGVLTAYKNGAVKVTATAFDGSGKTGSLTVTISNQTSFTPVSGITVSSTGQITAKSGALQMTAAVTPVAAVQNVKWMVLNPSGVGPLAATVNNAGVLTARYDGAVTVRATATDGSGVYGEQTVTVSNQNPQTVPARKVVVQLVGGSAAIDGAGGYAQYQAAVYPPGADSGAVTWSVLAPGGADASGNAKITVNDDGTVTVTGKYNGAYEICAAVNNGGTWPQAYAMADFTVTNVKDRTVYAYQLIKATGYNDGNKTFNLENSGSDLNLGGVSPGDWCGFKALNFGDNPSVDIQITGGQGNSGSAVIQVRDGAPEGPLLATLQFTYTGGWYNLETQTFPLAGLTGVHDLYFVFTNGGFLFNSFAFDGVNPPITVDRAALNSAIAALAGVDTDPYTSDSVTKMIAVYNSVKSLAADSAVNFDDIDDVQAAVDAAAASLTAAMSAPTNGDLAAPGLWLLGDVNRDGKIDTTDARLVLQAIVNKTTLTDGQRSAADVNSDGKIDTVDARLILQYIVGKIEGF